MTRVYGLLGWPVAHSRSPAMLNAAFAAMNVDASYVPFPVESYALADAVRGLLGLGIAGANVTVPHKTAVLALLDSVDEEARAVGAVNTIVRLASAPGGERARLRGANTDVGGLVRALVEAGAVLGGARALVLGSGGGARAAVYGLAQAGAHVTLAARHADAARTLCEDALALGDGAALRAALERADIVVQATSATMHTGDERIARAFVASLPLDALRPGTLVAELVYAPRDTALLVAARARGARTLDGTAMLLHQGALAFELWTGLPAPLDVMRAALDACGSA